MDCEKLASINNLLKENIMIATGCTEPVAVALCVAKASELLGQTPVKAELRLSKNVIKNAMGVGIPGTGMIGLPIAISLGVISKDSEKGLEILDNSENILEEATRWMEEYPIEICPKDTEEKLYIETRLEAGDGTSSRAIIAGSHTNFVYYEKDSEVLFEKEIVAESQEEEEGIDIDFEDIYNFAVNSPIDNLEWIIDTAKLNLKAAEEGLDKPYGLRLGRVMLNEGEVSTRTKVIAKTCAASDTRMDGATTPIYSNSGSGNQGIVCTVPVYVYGLESNSSEEEIIRALVVSHLLSIYIKQFIGKLSALCGIINASIGAGAGILYLRGGNKKQMGYFIRNMINNITGMVCDGAKPSCSLKVSSALNAAFDSIDLAIKDIVVDNTDGISENSVDNSIRSLGKLGRYGMDEIDELILDIMTTKQS